MAIAALERISAMPCAPALVSQGGQPRLFFRGEFASASGDYLGGQFFERKAQAKGDGDGPVVAAALAVSNPAVFENEADLVTHIWREGVIGDSDLLGRAVQDLHGIEPGSTAAGEWLARYESHAAGRLAVHRHIFADHRSQAPEDQAALRRAAAACGDVARAKLSANGFDGVFCRNGGNGNWFALDPREQVVPAYTDRGTPGGGGGTLDASGEGEGPAVVTLYRGQACASDVIARPSWMDDDERVKISKAAEGRWFSDQRSEAEWYVANEHLGRGEISQVVLLASFAERFRVANLPLKPGGKSVVDNPRAFSLRPDVEFYLPRAVASAARPLEAARSRMPLPVPDPALTVTLCDLTPQT